MTATLEPIGFVRAARDDDWGGTLAVIELLPRGALRQPPWSHALMERYWRAGEPDRGGSGR